jgi:hypothetical protein
MRTVGGKISLLQVELIPVNAALWPVGTALPSSQKPRSLESQLLTLLLSLVCLPVPLESAVGAGPFRFAFGHGSKTLV